MSNLKKNKKNERCCYVLHLSNGLNGWDGQITYTRPWYTLQVRSCELRRDTSGGTCIAETMLFIQYNTQYIVSYGKIMYLIDHVCHTCLDISECKKNK